MTPPIVVGIDLSNASIIALEEALPIARRRGADIVLAHVTQVPNTTVSYPWLGGATLARYHDLLEEALTESRNQLSSLLERYSGQGVTLSTTLINGEAARGIGQVADDVSTQLIVVGSHGRQGVDRFLLGSVAERVSRFTQHDVLVARHQKTHGIYQRILVPTDFSPAARKAFDIALEFVEEDAQITLLHSVSVPPGVAGFVTGDTIVEMEKATLSQLDSWAEKARSSGIEVSTVIRSGYPPAHIRELAGDHDLVVMGSHGRRGFKRFILGSVAEKTIHHAPCSVYIARAIARAPAQEADAD